MSAELCVSVLAAGRGTRMKAGLRKVLHTGTVRPRAANDLRGERKPHRQRRPLARCALDADLAAQQAHELRGDGEAQPCAASAPRRVCAVEAIEDPGEVLGRDPGAVVAHPQAGAAAVAIGHDADRSARGRVLEGVVDEGPEHLAKPPEVALCPHRRGAECKGEVCW